MRFIKYLLPVCTLFVIFSCQPEIDPGPGPGPIPVTPSPLQGSLQGKVIDQNDMPVAGATVRSGSAVTTTDADGLFRFPTITLDKYASVVTVEMNGYFRGIRTFTSKAGANNFVKIKLLQKTVSGTVNGATGGAVSVSGSTITFPASSIVNKTTGAAYTGTVNVYASFIDPTSEDMPFIVPGSLQAITLQNTRSLLTSYGMMAVELVGQSGENLQIATGKTARLKMQIPSSLTASAPASLPLWSLNETDGLWKQEGNATRNGNFYEGDVSHFSFWNCDVSVNAVYLEMTIHTAEGPLPHTLVKITRLNSNTQSYGYTDSLGYVAGFVPNGEPLKLEIFNTCADPIYSQNIGPYSQNTNLGTITVTLPAQWSVTVEGTAVNCSGAPVTSGNAWIYFEGQTYSAPISNGNFSTMITRCSNTSAPVEVIVVDYTSNQQSTTFNGNVTSNTLNTGSLSACGVSTVSYINYTLDGNNFSLTSQNGDSVSANVQGGQAVFMSGINTVNQNVSIYFGFSGAAVGTFPMMYLSVNMYDSTTIVTPFNVNVTTFGVPGQFIEGNFSGQFREMPNNTLHNISATFRVRRW